MRKTAMNHGFSEDEIGTTYDERMLSILHKAAKYDKMVANKPLPGAAGGAAARSQPGSAPRVGNSAQRGMNDAMHEAPAGHRPGRRRGRCVRPDVAFRGR